MKHPGGVIDYPLLADGLVQQVADGQKRSALEQPIGEMPVGLESRTPEHNMWLGRYAEKLSHHETLTQNLLTLEV